MVPLTVVGEFQVFPVADAYCTDQLDMVIEADVGLNSSTKSLRHVAPELPPAPYIWLITICDTPVAGVLVLVLVLVLVFVGVLVAPGTGVFVRVAVGVIVGVRVLVGVTVIVEV